MGKDISKNKKKAERLLSYVNPFNDSPGEVGEKGFRILN